jgi:ABC-type branched-subunit amino acid transport system substrate-binding protein
MLNKAYDIEKTSAKNILESSKKKAVLILSSVRTNTEAIQIANEIREKSLRGKIPKLLLSMALSESEIREKANPELIKEAIMIRPCVSRNSKSNSYLKTAEKWGIDDINWRTVTSYDAVQVFATAIEKIKEINRAC